MSEATTPGQRVRAGREALRENGLPVTQARFAARVGVKLRTVQSWEADERTPSGATLVRLAEVLGVTEAFIMEGRTEPSGGPAPQTAEEREREEKLIAVRWMRRIADALELEAKTTPRQGQSGEEPDRGEIFVKVVTGRERRRQARGS